MSIIIASNIKKPEILDLLKPLLNFCISFIFVLAACVICHIPKIIIILIVIILKLFNINAVQNIIVLIK